MTSSGSGEAETILEPLSAGISASRTGQEPPASGDISGRIAAILDTAEEEAEKIRERARAEASTIIRAAHSSAAERVDELTREPERLRNEAEREANELLENARHD